MSWAFNPSDPFAEPVRSGLRQEGFGDQAPAIAPYYKLTCHQQPGSIIPEIDGGWVLTHRTVVGQAFGFGSGHHANPLSPRLWRGPRIETSVVVFHPDFSGNLAFRWNLAFGAEYEDSFGATHGHPHSWSIAIENLTIPGSMRIWSDPLHNTIYNRFLPFGRNTIHGLQVVPTSYPVPQGLWDSLPESITVEAWWP